MALYRLSKIPLIALIFTFIALDFTLLFVNINLTTQLKHNALIINAAGRQRMLSQRIAKNILIQYSQFNTQQSTLESQLIEASDLFNQTLTAFTHGGEIITPSGEIEHVLPLTDQKSKQLLAQTAQIWTQFYSTIQAFSNNNQSNSLSYLPTLYNFSTTGSEEILALTNQLAVRTEQIASENAQSLQYAQIGIFALVLINFFLILARITKANSNSNAFMQQLNSLVKNLPQAILFIDDSDTIIYANRSASPIFNIKNKELVGRNINHLVCSPLENGPIILGDRHFELSVSNMVTIPRRLKMVSLLDITEKKDLQLKSLVDPLTQLYNRNGLEEIFSNQLNTISSVVCLFLDLNKFKEVNDLYGHSTGDHVLNIIATRLRASVKQSDIVSRFGGDEFVIILGSPISKDDLQHLCDRLKKTVAEEITTEETVVSLGVSIGVYIGNQETQSLATIIDQADKAMYSEKKGQLISNEQQAISA